MDIWGKFGGEQFKVKLAEVRLSPWFESRSLD